MNPWIAALVPAAEGILALALLLVLYRVVRGPDLADRFVGLDVFAVLVVGVIIAEAVRNQQAAYLDVAIVFALMAFLSTLAFAYYLLRGAP